MKAGLVGVALTVAAVALAGCEGVTSSKPLFDAGDISLAQLKPGVWEATSANCPKVLPEGAPKSQCTVEFAITANEVTLGVAEAKAMKDADGHPPSLPKVSYILASGDPLVLQLTMADRSGGVRSSAHPQPIIMFAALKPLVQGVDGQITNAEVWPVECGPRPASDAQGAGGDAKAISDAEIAAQAAAELDSTAGDGRTPTRHAGAAFAGMKMSPDGGSCTPNAPDAVRQAAGKSLAKPSESVTISWLREADE